MGYKMLQEKLFPTEYTLRCTILLEVFYDYLDCVLKTRMCVLARRYRFIAERFHVLMAASVKQTACCDTASCNLQVDPRFSGTYCLHHQGDE
jgi:hypothetical protein